MTNVSSEEGKGGAPASMEVVGVGAEGVVDGVVEETMSPEIQYMGHIAYSVVAPVIISFGILTNVLNLVVLSRPSLRGPTFRYLMWLAVANLMVCVVLLPFTLHSNVTPVPYAAALYFAHIEVPVGNALIASSVYIVVGLSIDRFVAVCYPRKYRNLHSHYVASVRIALSFIIAFIIYIPMAFYKMVVPSGVSPDRFLIKGNLQVVSTRWFVAYEYLLEICVRHIGSFNTTYPCGHCTLPSLHAEHLSHEAVATSKDCCRFAPAVLLGVLNTWIIIEFKRISRRRLLLSRGISCEVSAIPSQSYFEGNANSTVVNPSPTSGQVEKDTDPAASTTPAPSSDLPLGGNTTTATNDESPIHRVSYSDGYALEKERTNIDSQGFNNNGHLAGGQCVSTTIMNGYSRVLAGEDLVDCKNSMAPSVIRDQQEEETIVLSTINVSAAPPPVPPPRHGMSERRHDMERRLVLLLISIIVAFFITNIPAAILSLTFSDGKRKDLNYQIFRAVANNLEFLNFGLNFILYFLFSKDIRNAFTALMRRTIDRFREGLEGSSNKYGATNL
ncbi:putative G-protein coupled receptor AH9.1 [Chionoecetes opilio]|uniref:Putative G-protein coupled receptor AH9.1 n=1 Tax=Chionoecetes opilio TaxID=41210 RepID=A0A8J4XZ49_CHIOP|nr:putative G-protein coupled receptor AH9.1 [Chionoecetes opilio]